jgi:hypothetical protein
MNTFTTKSGKKVKVITAKELRRREQANKKQNKIQNARKPRNRRNRKPKNNNGNMATNTATYRPRHRMVQIEDGIRIEASSLVADVASNQFNQPNGATTISLNPLSEAMPRLKRWAQGYTKFRINHSHIEFQPAVGTVLNGSVFCYPVYSVTESDCSTEIEIGNTGDDRIKPLKDIVHFPAYKKMYDNLKIYDIGDAWDTPPYGTVNALGYVTRVPARFVIGTLTVSNPLGGPIPTNVGRIVHHYSIDLLHEDKSAVIDQNGSYLQWSVTALTAGAPDMSNGVTQVLSRTEDGATVSNNGNLTLLPTGSTWFARNVRHEGGFAFRNPGKYILSVLIQEIESGAGGVPGFSGNIADYKISTFGTGGSTVSTYLATLDSSIIGVTVGVSWSWATIYCVNVLSTSDYFAFTGNMMSNANFESLNFYMVAAPMGNAITF